MIEKAEGVTELIEITFDEAQAALCSHPAGLSSTDEEIAEAWMNLTDEVKAARLAIDPFRRGLGAARMAGDIEEMQALQYIVTGLEEFLMSHDPDHIREMAQQSDRDFFALQGEHA